MSTVTPIYGWPVPELTDPANILQISTTLAPAIETTIAALPRGTVGYNAITASSSSVSAVTDAGPTVTFTAVAGRRYRTTIGGNWFGSVAGDLLIAYISDNSASKQRQTFSVAAPGWGQVSLSVVETGLTPGSTVRKFQHERNTGTGTSQIVAGALFPAFVLVEDIGT